MAHLRVTESREAGFTMEQRDDENEPVLSDRWVFDAKWDGCVNFGQMDPSTTGEIEAWYHLCDIDLMIEMLSELRAEMVRRFPEDR